MISTQVETWLSISGGVLVILAALALIFVYLAGSYNKQRIQALREDVEDAQRREQANDRQIERLEQEAASQLAAFQLKVDNCNEKIVHLTAENEHLRELVLQRVEFNALNVSLEEIIELMGKHDKKVEEYWRQILRAASPREEGQDGTV